MKNLSKTFSGKFLFGTLKFTVAAASLYFVLTLVSFQQLLELFRTANYWYILGGVLFLPLNTFLRIVRWKMLVASLNGEVNWKQVTASVLLGITFGSFTPGEFGDFFGRMLHLPDTRKSHVVGLVLVDKIQIMLAMALIGLPTFFFLALASPFLRYFLTGIVLVLIVTVNMLLGARFSFLVQRFQHVRYLGNITSAMFQLERRQQLATFLLSILLLIVIGVQMYFFFNAFYPVPIAEGIFGTGLMLLVKSFIPISIGDLGIRELTTAYIFSRWNIPLSVSVNASLLLFAVNVFLPSVCGIVVFLFHKAQR